MSNLLKIPSVSDYIEELDRKYPDRHKTIHKTYCKHCPSNVDKINGHIDPESEDIKKSCSKKLIAEEFLFVCAWRPNKLCKGNCEDMDIDQNYLNNLYNK